MLTPGGEMRWGRCAFDLNPPPGGDADYYVVLGNARPFDHAHVAKENTLFIAGEPPAKKVYPTKFYNQFYRLVDTHALSNHPRVTLSAPGLGWQVGLDTAKNQYRYGYDHLISLKPPAKENRISVVCSAAAKTPGQRRRLEFLHTLKRRLGDRIVHYGRGFAPIEDKMDAILPYRFHLVLENSESPHYWTEKLADAYLGWAFPLYVGCDNLDEYFSSDAFVRLNPGDTEAAVARIEKMLDSNPDPAELARIAEARERVLNNYNPFAWCCRWAETFYSDSPPVSVTMRSHRAFRPFPRGLLYRIKQFARTVAR